VVLQTRKKIPAAVIAASLCLFQSGVSIAGTPDLNADKLSGDWDGARTRMAERGIVWEIVYKGDTLADVSGGFAAAQNTWITWM
jgi:carbohydrate-selective porin OprB